ncbi:hypothetical protein PF004_g14497 [Phytophthora fragariae]|uniref:Uncharacterized protein n=1 Tax=Phytophthora fragariae TaxID=53985 RepID=A0A6G0NP25_9STRA|nr:hypothetical protein PF004_g14497 [Phytophthora fragariae]
MSEVLDAVLALRDLNERELEATHKYQALQYIKSQV